MFQLCGTKALMKNFIILCHDEFQGAAPLTHQTLKTAFLDYLESYQPTIPKNRLDDKIIDDVDIEKALISAYDYSAIDDLEQTRMIGEPQSPAFKAERLEQIREALQSFLSLDSGLSSVFDIAIHSIFTHKSKRNNGMRAAGASSSNGIGAIWISDLERLTHYNLVEMLIHELTHHLIFIDELRMEQFYYKDLAKEENFAQSAILKRPRPLDKVVHSIIVSTEIILSREAYDLPDVQNSLHPTGAEFRAQVEQSIQSLFALPHLDRLVTQRVVELVRQCEDRLGFLPANLVAGFEAKEPLHA